MDFFGFNFKVYFLIWAGSISSAAGDKGTQTVSEASGALIHFFETIWDKIPYFVASLVVVIVAHLLAKTFQRYTENALLRKWSHAEALSLIGKSAYYAIMGIGLSTAFSVAGIDVSLIMSSIGFGLWFAMKGIVFNYMAGLMIIIQEPFSAGDLIEIKGILGKVTKIEMRNIFLKTLNGQEVMIANADFFNLPVINYSHYPERRINQEITVKYTEDLSGITRLLFSVLHKNKNILRAPKPIVTFDNFDDYGIKLIIRYWVSSDHNWIEVKSQVIQDIKYVFDYFNCQFPFPTYELVSYSDTGMKLDIDKQRTTQKSKQDEIFDEIDEDQKGNIYNMERIEKEEKKKRKKQEEKEKNKDKDIGIISKPKNKLTPKDFEKVMKDIEQKLEEKAKEQTKHLSNMDNIDNIDNINKIDKEDKPINNIEIKQDQDIANDNNKIEKSTKVINNSLKVNKIDIPKVVKPEKKIADDFEEKIVMVDDTGKNAKVKKTKEEIYYNNKKKEEKDRKIRYKSLMTNRSDFDES